MSKFVAMFFPIVCATLVFATGDAAGGKYQRVADTAEWGWKLAWASPLFSAQSRVKGSYDVKLEFDHRERSIVKITIITAEGADVFSWRGHQASVFCVTNQRLYYAIYSPTETGALIVAVDLETKKELWRSPVTGLGSIEHSAYLNFLNLDWTGGVLIIYGCESLGHYIEIKDAATGTTVGHKIFSPPG